MCNLLLFIKSFYIVTAQGLLALSKFDDGLFLQKVSSWSFDRVLNLPLQRLQVRWHDNVKALYDDHKKECLSEVYLTIKIKWLWVLDYLTFCLTLFFQLISLAVLTYLETLGPRVYCITILYLEFFEGISQKG